MNQAPIEATESRGRPAPSAPPTVLLAPGDGGGVLRLFLPLASRLRERGYRVRFFTANLRDRMLLRRHGEEPVVSRLAGPSVDIPPVVEQAAAVRADASQLELASSRRHRDAQSVMRAARRALDDVDLVVVWNGSDLQTAALADVARTNRQPIWFLENGLIPGHVQCDPAGVNAAASLAPGFVDSTMSVRRPIEFLEHTADDCRAPERGFRSPPFWWRCVATSLEWAEAIGTPERARLSIRARLRDMRGARLRRRPLAGGDDRPLPSRFVFVPLQVHDDSNIWRHGDWVDSMETLCRSLREARLDLDVVVRQHPMDVGRTDYEGLRRDYPEFLWTRTRDLDECLHRAAAVVTVNSTVGFEALERGRPVVVCGHAIYGDASAVERAADGSDMRRALLRAIEQGSAKAGADGVCRMLREEVHVEIDRFHPDGAGLERLIDRLMVRVQHPMARAQQRAPV